MVHVPPRPIPQPPWLFTESAFLGTKTIFLTTIQTISKSECLLPLQQINLILCTSDHAADNGG